jgi:FKBP-type peptidyl-prolyl cis-trans isomerase
MATTPGRLSDVNVRKAYFTFMSQLTSTQTMSVDTFVDLLQKVLPVDWAVEGGVDDDMTKEEEKEKKEKEKEKKEEKKEEEKKEEEKKEEEKEEEEKEEKEKKEAEGTDGTPVVVGEKR